MCEVGSTSSGSGGDTGIQSLEVPGPMACATNDPLLEGEPG